MPEVLPLVGGVGPDALKQAFRRHAAGVAVVTVDAGDGPQALTVSSLTSVSADPAVVLFSVSTETVTGRAAVRAETAVVHLLDATDHPLAVRCAMPGVDRFDGASPWERLPTGEPSFTEPHTRLRGRIVRRTSFDTATVLMLEIVEVIERPATADDAPPRPLAYVGRTWHALDGASAIG